jgi:hypothetical protein
LIAIADALPILGYGTIYHMREVYKNGHGPNWMAALNAKFRGEGKPYGREEYDAFLGDYSVSLIHITSIYDPAETENTQGVSDIPASVFVEDFMDAYPEAKIILTTRVEEKWLASMQKTLWSGYNTDKEHSVIASFMRDNIWSTNPVPTGIQKFKAHNELVLKAAKERGREVLVYQVKEGWEPLCTFLGKKVPEEEFPNHDDHRPT